MMKKILSILLTVCMLMSMVIVPVAVQAESDQELSAYEKSTLGSYYKFTFGEDGDRFQYTVGNNQTSNTTGQHTYKKNTFYPLWTFSMYTGADLAERMSWGYKTVEDAAGKTYDVVEIKNSTNGLFTPLTTNGTPFEMKPGAKYKVNVEYFNPIASAGGSLQIGAATTNKKETTQFSGQYWNDSGVLTNSSYMYAYLPYRSGGKGPVNGQAYNVYVPGKVSTSGAMALTCINDSCGTKNLNIYRNDTAIIGIPAENAVLNEANQSYTVNVPNGDATIEANNYFTLCFNTNNISVTSASHPIYSPEGTALPEGTELNTWQIVSIEIYEMGVGSANLHINGDVITVKGEEDVAVDFATAEAAHSAPEGYSYEWYSDSKLTEKVDTATIKYKAGKPVDLYAKLVVNDTYLNSTLGNGDYYKFTFGKGESYDNYRIWFKNAMDQYGYAGSHQKAWKGNNFFPMWSNSTYGSTGVAAERLKAEKKEISVLGGDTYNVLEVSNLGDVVFTPLAANGQPYELAPGESYNIRVKMFVPRQDVWNHSYFSLGNNVTTDKNSYPTDSEKDANSIKALYPYAKENLSVIKGDQWAYNFAEGTYNEDTVIGNCLGLHGTCSGTGYHASRDSKVYIDEIVTIDVPAAGEGGVFTYDEANNSYSGKLTTTDNKEYNLNNYLTLYLGGGNANGYVSNANCGFYGSEGVDTTGTAYNTYQIVSIEVWKTDGVGTANLHIDDQIFTVNGIEGNPIPVSNLDVEAPAEGYVYNWYTDETYTTEATLTFAEGAVDLYAKVEKNAYEKSTLGSSYKFTFEEGAYDNYKVWTRNSFDQGLKSAEYRANWKNNTFLPLWSPHNAHSNSANMTASLEEITVKGNKPYNVLEVTASNDVVLTPLAANGQPYELTPGKSYNIRVKMFVPREDVWNSSYFSLGNNVTNTGTNASWPTANTAEVRPYSSGSISSIGGDTYACNFADGTYDEETEFGLCKQTGCTHTQRWNKVYVDKTVTINVPDTVEKGGIFEYDKENNAYSGTYTVGGKEYKVNNYLTMFLGGGDANNYANNTAYGFYGSEGVDTSGKAYNTYQIVSIEVSEAGAVNFAPNDATSIMKDAADGHTYKVDFSYVTTNLDSDVKYNFGSANPYNAYDFKSLVNANDFVIKKEETKPGKKYEVTRYITVDLAGGIKDLTELGSDYHIDNSYDELYMYFTQEDGANNNLEFSDFSITDLGEVVGTGGASILTNPEETGNKQAIRYYFNYTTFDGKVLKMDGKEFPVVARGFVYANGTLGTMDSNGRYLAGLTLNNNNNPYKLIERVKNSDFDQCWKLETTDVENANKMTFSTYIKGFKENDDRKLMIRGFVTVKDPVTNEEFTVYSDTINRSVMNIKASEDGSARSLVWAEEFDNGAASMPGTEGNAFNHKYNVAGNAESVAAKEELGLFEVATKDGTPNDNLYIENDETIDSGVLTMETYTDNTGTYYSKSLSTYDKMTFRYGYLEMRAKVPSVQGAIAAFWLRSSNPHNPVYPFGEIDIFEVNGTLRDTEIDNYGTIETTFHKWLGNGVHCQGPTGSEVSGYNNEWYEFDPNVYHTFGMEWTPETITFYVDGTAYYKVDMTKEMCDHDDETHHGMDCFNDSTQQYFVVLGHAVFNSVDQANWGAEAEKQWFNKIDGGVNAEYNIDYVRLYQNASYGESVNKK